MHRLSREFSISSRPPVVALLPWGNVLEDFLDPIGVSLEEFCTAFTGSWIYGYADALRAAGVRVTLIGVSSRVREPTRFTHDPTGATICILPATRVYLALREKARNPYARTVGHMFGEALSSQRLLFPVLAVLREIILYLPLSPSALARELRRQRCEAVLCQEYEYPRFDMCVLLGRVIGIPTFASFQGGDYQRSHIERFLRPLALRACSGLIIAPRSEIRRVRQRYGISPARIARIFNPIDIDTWRPSDGERARRQLSIPVSARVAVWHGRVDMQKKGLDVLLAAWEIVCHKRSDRPPTLLLVGTGPDAGALHQRITDMQESNVVWIDEFTSDRSILRTFLSAANVYVFPSRHEGFPVAPIEAMACGLPIVATDVSGIPDILERGEASGGVVVPVNDPEALASALGRLLDNPDESRELGKHARKRVEELFSLRVVGEQLRAFLIERRFQNYPDQ